MEEMIARGWEELLGRETGALHLRFVLQPLVATFFAVRSGLRDAREGRPVFFWTVVLAPQERRALLSQLWTDVGKLFLAALLLDAVYQALVLHAFHPIQALIVAGGLAVLPYLTVRGLTNRVARWTAAKKPEDESP